MEEPSSICLNVQPLLTAAAAQLDKGEMLHGSGFSLSGVMSAVEIGDPKLDAGKYSLSSLVVYWSRAKVRCPWQQTLYLQLVALLKQRHLGRTVYGRGR